MTLQVHQLGDGQGDWSGTVPEHSNLWPRHPLHRPPLRGQVRRVTCALEASVPYLAPYSSREEDHLLTHQSPPFAALSSVYVAL